MAGCITRWMCRRRRTRPSRILGKSRIGPTSPARPAHTGRAVRPWRKGAGRRRPATTRPGRRATRSGSSARLPATHVRPFRAAFRMLTGAICDDCANPIAPRLHASYRRSIGRARRNARGRLRPRAAEFYSVSAKRRRGRRPTCPTVRVPPQPPPARRNSRDRSAAAAAVRAPAPSGIQAQPLPPPPGGAGRCRRRTRPATPARRAAARRCSSTASRIRRSRGAARAAA